ncbi:MAG: hypothetical protein IT430_19015 [Phycisphaerales bacterium]|nr:hypothetical protein [Phycisphaerales bacterium]
MAERTTTIDPASKARNLRPGVAWSEALSLLALGSFMALSAAVIGPRLIRGSPTAPDASASVLLSGPLAGQQQMLRDLLDRAAAILALHESTTQAGQLDTLVLWLSDDRFPGQVNLSEVLVIRFSPMLRSIIAYTWAPPAEEDPILSDQAWATPHRVEELAARTDVVRAVVAQPVIACEVTGIRTAQTLRPDATEEPLALRLTWFDESTDSRDVSTIRTGLRLLARSRRF